MTAGHAGRDLSRRYHGASNSLECEDGCGPLHSALTDRQALRLARDHARAWRHTVTRVRESFQDISPRSDDVR